MSPIEKTAEDRLRQYDKQLSKFQTDLWLDVRIPMEVMKELDKRLCEIRGLPF